MRHLGAGLRWGSAALVLLALVLPSFAEIPDTDLAFLTTSVPSQEKSSAVLPSILQPMLAVLIFGGLLFGSLYMAYRKRRNESDSALIHVLAAAPIAQGVVVQIVDAGGVLYVVALSRTGQTLLGQITDRDKISEIRTRVAQESMHLAIAPVPFKAALERLFSKPRRGADAGAGDQPRPAAREKILQEVLDRVRRLNPTEKDQ